MMTLKTILRHSGVRMLIAGAALHGIGPMILADGVVSAGFQTSDVSRGKQVSLIADEKAPPPLADDTPGRIQNAGPGVARVPGCASIASPDGACANGACTARAGACGPQGCVPGRTGCGANGCPTCRSGRSGGMSGSGSTIGNAGRVWHGAGQATSQAMNRTLASAWRGPECDWNDELSERSNQGYAQGNGPCPEHGQMNCPHCCGWLHDQWGMFNARNRQQGEILRAHIHGKLAYFHPMGNGGEGVPPFGCYHLVYAVNPNYSDPRDSQIYAAQGWGVPMSVPLAPTVRHTMNYSTGIPSSRLTPISNVVPPRGGRSW